MDSLRNSDILAVIEARVPERIKEIEREEEALNKQIRELGEEKATLLGIMAAAAPVDQVGTFPRFAVA